MSGTVSPAAGGSGTSLFIGGALLTTTADGSGNYNFTGLPNGTYTVTPSKSGYTFSPPNRSVTINGADVTGVNFTAQAVAHDLQHVRNGESRRRRQRNVLGHRRSAAHDHRRRLR